MRTKTAFVSTRRAFAVLHLAVRLGLGGIFVYTGIAKVIDPVSFLKAVRSYELTASPYFLNSIAAILPWLEILAGAFILIGFMTRGASAVLLSLLTGFTAVILWRAIGLLQSNGDSFCAIYFDCGCGLGEVGVCGKLLQNFALCLGAVLVLLAGRHPMPWQNPGA